MKNAMLYLLLFLVIFENIISNIVEMPLWFGYWDESVFLLMIIWLVLELSFSGKINLKENDRVIFLCVLFIIIIGLASNYYYNFAATMSGIVRDVVQFSKFPISFVVMRRMCLDKRMSICIARIIPYLKVYIIIMTFLGLLTIFIDIGMVQDEVRHGIHPYMFLYNHPTSFVIANVLLLGILGSFCPQRTLLPYEILISINVILSMRTKAFAWLGAYFFLKYSATWLKKYKKIYVFSLLAIVIFIGSDKIVQLNSFSNSTRMYNYVAGIELMLYTFPLGGGFASFASQLAVKDGSLAYDVLATPPPWHYFGIYNLDEMFIIQAGDTGFPYYYAQFGVMGFVVFMVLVRYLLKLCSREGVLFINSLMILVYILISLTTEAILVNSGLQLGILLAIIMHKEKKGIER